MSDIEVRVERQGYSNINRGLVISPEDLPIVLHETTMDVAREFGVDILDPEAVKPVVKAIIIFEEKCLKNNTPTTIGYQPLFLGRFIKEEVVKDRAERLPFSL